MTRIARAVLLTILAMLLLPALMPGSAHAGSTGGNRNGAAPKLIDDNGTCASLKPYTTDIAVDLVQADPVFDNQDSWGALRNNADRIRADWLEKNKLKDLWSVNDLTVAGLAFAGMDTVYSFDVTSLPVDRYGVYYCDFFKTVSVQLLYRPVVKIPGDVKSHSCAYEVISAHEELVLDADKSAIEDFVKRLRGDMPGIIALIETGYVGKEGLEDRPPKMKQDMQEAVEVYLNDTLSVRLKQASAAVNTSEEFTALKGALDDCRKKTPPSPPPPPAK